MSTDAPTARNLRSPPNSGRESARVVLEAEAEANDAAARPSSPATQVPASNPSHKRAVLTLPSNQHSLVGYGWSGEYSDLRIDCGGFKFPAHRIIVCSESPVLKAMCSNLEPGQSLRLDQFDPETLNRVLSFCYVRIYNDGEFPDIVAPFLTSMTAKDVLEALEAPLAILSDVDNPEWVTERTECADSEGSEPEQDEYLPSSCDIHCALEYDSDSSDDEMPSADTPSEPEKPPYNISLFANFNVYIAAKELQIPGLQLVARERFAHSLRAHWARFADLPALIEQVYSRTDETDPLRALICQCAAAAYDSEFDMAFQAEIRELMTKNGQFAAEVLDATLRLRRGWADAWMVDAGHLS